MDIVKGICDWEDGTKSKNKQKNHVIAAESAVSLLKHIFTNEKTFEKIQNKSSEIKRV